jgi:ABC-type lipoprotein export system ATPase subunit
MINNNFIKIRNLSKSYEVNYNKLTIINELSLDLQKNCIVSIVGPSGSGKSTFLNIIGLLDRDFLGEYELNGKDMKHLSKKQLNYTRGSSIGFVHQFFHLIPELNVIENVMLPYLINSKQSDNFKLAKNLLETFGLNDRMNFKPIKLSGGEQQRVAIARSLINNPDLILADEMTGNLDENTAKEIFNFFLSYVKENKKSLIFVTHNNYFAEQANNIFKFSNANLEKIK